MIESKTEQLLIDFEAIERSSDLKKRLQNYLSHQYGIDEYYAKNISSWIGSDSEEDESGLSDQLKEFQLATQKNKRKYVERISKKIDSIKKGPAERVLKRLKANAMKDLEVLRSIINDVEKSFTRKDEKYETIVQHVIERLLADNHFSQRGRSVKQMQFSVYVIGYSHMGYVQSGKLRSDSDNISVHNPG